MMNVCALCKSEFEDAAPFTHCESCATELFCYMLEKFDRQDITREEAHATIVRSSGEARERFLKGEPLARLSSESPFRAV